MKTIYNTGKIIIGIILLIIPVTANSQDFTREKLSKEEKREVEKQKTLYNYQVVDTMLENKNFVLEADYLENRSGIRRPVSSLLNFIRLDSTHAVLQTGSDMYEGTNAVGGVTAEGNVQRLKLMKDTKKHYFFLRFTVMTNIGIYDIAMTVYPDKRARAEITGLGPGKLIYNGHIVNSWESRVYKGRNTI